MATPLKTKLNRGWLVKMAIFFIVLVGFGVWGLIDALYFYPANGLADASFKLKNYLAVLSKSTARLTASGVKVADPRAELTLLTNKATGRSGSGGPLSDAETARLEWLTALSRVWKLDAAEVRIYEVERVRISPAGTPVFGGLGTTGPLKERLNVYFQPRSGVAVAKARDGTSSTDQPDVVLKELDAYWKTAKARKPLAAYDLPSQWLFVVGGFGGGAYLLVLVLRVASRKYSYDPQTHELTLRGGVTISPDDVKEFDKRRWHKFFLILRLRDGRSFKLDLLRYVPLEEWALEMERIAFPESAGAPPHTDVPPAAV